MLICVAPFAVKASAGRRVYTAGRSEHTSLFSESILWPCKDGHHLKISDKTPEKMGFLVLKSISDGLPIPTIYDGTVYFAIAVNVQVFTLTPQNGQRLGGVKLEHTCTSFCA